MSEEDERVQRRERVLSALKAYSMAQKEYGQVFARSQKMHTSDAAAIVEILIAERRGAPLTPARLAERIALSPAATSTLLNRLEEAGDVVRRRGHQDRRVATLHGTARVQERADAFYAPLNQAVDDVMTGYSDAELDLVEKIVDDLHDVISRLLSRPDHQPPAR
jgi:DNA-binding MarR family transcriptional regulator